MDKTRIEERTKVIKEIISITLTFKPHTPFDLKGAAWYQVCTYKLCTYMQEASD